MENDFIEEYEVDIRNTTNTGEHKVILSFDENRQVTVDYEIDGVTDSVETVTFPTIEKARKYVKEEYNLKTTR